MGDKGYRGCEYVEVCESKEQKGIRQVVEGVNSQIKLFNRVSRWRKGITLLAYLYGYAIGYSFFRKSHVWGVIFHPTYVDNHYNTNWVGIYLIP